MSHPFISFIETQSPVSKLSKESYKERKATQRKNLIEILRYLSTMGFKMEHWVIDARGAEVLAGALENDSV